MWVVAPYMHVIYNTTCNFKFKSYLYKTCPAPLLEKPYRVCWEFLPKYILTSKSQDLAKDIGGKASKAEKKICKSKNCI